MIDLLSPQSLLILACSVSLARIFLFLSLIFSGAFIITNACVHPNVRASVAAVYLLGFAALSDRISSMASSDIRSGSGLLLRRGGKRTEAAFSVFGRSKGETGAIVKDEGEGTEGGSR